MQANTTKAPAAIRVDLAAIFVSLELSRSKWLVTSLSPGGGERMSRHIVSGATFRVCSITSQSCNERRKCGQGRASGSYQSRKLVWMDSGYIGSSNAKASRVMSSTRHPLPHRVAVGGPRPTGLTGEALVRALLAYNRGEPRVCAMLRVPTPEEEDRRRLVRERKARRTSGSGTSTG